MITTDGMGRGGWLAALALVAASACSRPAPAIGQVGRQVAAGPARQLWPSPDGNWLAFLDHCARPPLADLPPDALDCDLVRVATAGGAVQRVAAAVSTLAAPAAWSADGRALAALADYDHATGRGRLVVVENGGEPRAVASGVSFFGFSPGGDALALIAGGQLLVKRSGEAEAREVAGAEGVTTFDFPPPARARAPAAGTALVLAARRAATAGGDLLGLARWDGPMLRIASQVGDYQFTPHGWLAFTARGRDGYALAAIPSALAPGAGASTLLAAAAPRVGANVQRFSFSPVDGTMAFLANVRPGHLGDLHTIGPGGAGQPVRLAGSVGEYRWATAARRLVWIQDYDPRVRSGTLAIGAPGERSVVVARNVDGFDTTPDGSRVAYLEHVTAGGYSVDLKLVEVGPDPHPQAVARGVFGFAFSPDGRRLYYRAGCLRNAEACDLYVTGGAAGEKAQRLAEGVKSFELDPRRPERLLITWSRKDLVALDLAVLQDGKLTAVGQAALPGSAQFLGPDSGRLAYIVAEPKRAGIYVVEVR